MRGPISGRNSRSLSIGDFNNDFFLKDIKAQPERVGIEIEIALSNLEQASLVCWPSVVVILRHRFTLLWRADIVLVRGVCKYITIVWLWRVAICSSAATPSQIRPLIEYGSRPRVIRIGRACGDSASPDTPRDVRCQCDGLTGFRYRGGVHSDLSKQNQHEPLLTAFRSMMQRVGLTYSTCDKDT